MNDPLQLNGMRTPSAALDAGRGLAILAVMYGHALAPWFMGAGQHFSEGAYLQWKFGASFMMPFFFFVSGLSWRANKSLWATLRESITLVLIALGASVAYDLLLFLLTKGGVEALFAQDALYGRVMVADILRSVLLGDHYALSALWFLTVLAGARMMAAICERFGRWSAVSVFALLLGGYLVIYDSYVPNFYQARQLWVGFGAFVLGHWSRDAFGAIRTKPLLVLALTLVAGAFAIGSFNLNNGCPMDFASQCGLGFLDGRFGVSIYAAMYGFLPMFVFSATVGTLMAIGLAILLARYGSLVGQLLRRMGRNSLNLLIVNALLLEFVNPLIQREIVPRTGETTPLFFVTLLALTIVVNMAVLIPLRPALTKLRSISRTIAVAIVSLLGQVALRAPKRQMSDASSQA